MKLDKSSVYVQIDTPEKCKAVYEVLTKAKEPVYTDRLEELRSGEISEHPIMINSGQWMTSENKKLKTEVSIEELAVILGVQQFKIGDRVSTGNGLGTIVAIIDNEQAYAVAHDDWSTGHNCYSGHIIISGTITGLNNNGWFYRENEIELVEEEATEFKTGDYIVNLDLHKSTYFPTDYIFKQDFSSNRLYTKKDAVGEQTQSAYVWFDDKTTWRYATPEEIAEYNKQNKPFDVTTMNTTDNSQSQTITREQLALIHACACSTWKAKITEFANRNPFANDITFTAEEVKSMFEAASSSQTEVLKEAGLVLPVEDTNAFNRVLTHADIKPLRDAGLSIEVCCGYADLVGRPELDGKALVLYSGEVVLHKAEDGSTVIEFKKK